MKCTDLLMQDHKVILRCLEVLDHMALVIGKGEHVERDDVEAVLRFLRAFADDHHEAMEESALFPELIRAVPAQAEPLRRMLFEHDQSRSLVVALEDALNTKKGWEFVHFANRLTALVRNHIYKEDNILFPIAERSLSSEQDEKVAAELSAFQINLGLLADLRRLEWRFLKKIA